MLYSLDDGELRLCFLGNIYPASSNDDDIDDEDTNEESSSKSVRHKEASEASSEMAEPSPGPSASSETQPLVEGDNLDEDGDKHMWPSATDLNTRLRRVITSYQRSYRKEEQQKLAIKAKVFEFDRNVTEQRGLW